MNTDETRELGCVATLIVVAIVAVFGAAVLGILLAIGALK